MPSVTTRPSASSTRQSTSKPSSAVTSKRRRPSSAMPSTAASSSPGRVVSTAKSASSTDPCRSLASSTVTTAPSYSPSAQVEPHLRRAVLGDLEGLLGAAAHLEGAGGCPGSPGRRRPAAGPWARSSAGPARTGRPRRRRAPGSPRWCCRSRRSARPRPGSGRRPGRGSPRSPRGRWSRGGAGGDGLAVHRHVVRRGRLGEQQHAARRVAGGAGGDLEAAYDGWVGVDLDRDRGRLALVALPVGGGDLVGRAPRTRRSRSAPGRLPLPRPCGRPAPRRLAVDGDLGHHHERAVLGGEGQRDLTARLDHRLAEVGRRRRLGVRRRLGLLGRGRLRRWRPAGPPAGSRARPAAAAAR